MANTTILTMLAILVAAGGEKTWICKEGAFVITWPGESLEETAKEKTARGAAARRDFHYLDSSGQFTVEFDDVVKVDPKLLDIQKTLDATIDDFAAQKYYRVLTRKKITLNNVPGREIEFEVKGDRLPMGNRGRARAYLDKDRFYQVIVLGTKAAGSPAADAFFDSFQIIPRTAAPPLSPTRSGEAGKPWELYTTRVGRFSAMMPPNPAETTKTADSDNGAKTLVIIQATEGPMIYVVTLTDVDAASASSPKKLLDSTRDLVVQSSKGKLLSEKKIEVARSPGREVKASIARGQDPEGGLITCRIYLVNRRVYQVMAVGPKDQAEFQNAIDEYFRSFRPTSGR